MSNTRKKEIIKQLNLLIFDIEMSYTTYMAWPRTGEVRLSYDQIIQDSEIIMISYKWAHEKTIQTLVWDFGDINPDLTVLKKFSKEAQKADYCIGYNSKGFDTKWINTRLCDLELDPLPIINQEDLYKSIRKKMNFPSYKLDYLVKRFGLGEKLQLTGWNHWKRVCEYNDYRYLKQMIKYCEMDVRLTEQLYWRVYDYIDHPFNMAVLKGLPEACPNCGSIRTKKHGFNYTKLGKRQRVTCFDCKRSCQLGKNLVKKSGEYNR